MLTKNQLNRILSNVQTLPEVLDDWQKLQGFNDSEAARQCGLTPQHYWKVKRGERTDIRIETLEKLANGTGLTIEFLAVASVTSRKKKMDENDDEPEGSDDTGSLENEASPPRTKAAWSKAGTKPQRLSAATS